MPSRGLRGARLRAATDEAVAAGVFGAPTFIMHADVGDLLYWGADRLELALLAASGDARASLARPRAIGDPPGMPASMHTAIAEVVATRRLVRQ